MGAYANASDQVLLVVLVWGLGWSVAVGLVGLYIQKRESRLPGLKMFVLTDTAVQEISPKNTGMGHYDVSRLQ